jgi:streptogramin lyase
VWVLDGTAGTLTQFSPAYSEVVRRIRTHGAFDDLPADRSDAFAPWSVKAGERGVWVTDGSPSLRLINPRRGKLAATLDLHRRLHGVPVGAGAVWAISGPGSTVLRLDPRTRRVTDRIQIVSRPGFESPYPVAIEVGAGSVWVLNANTQTVTRIDRRARGITATIPIGIERGPLRLAAGDGAAWVANDDGTLSRIDATSNAVRTFAVCPRAQGRRSRARRGLGHGGRRSRRSGEHRRGRRDRLPREHAGDRHGDMFADLLRRRPAPGCSGLIGPAAARGRTGRR